MKIPVHVAAALRTTLITALCYTLSVSGWDEAVPPSLSHLISLLGCIYALALPKFCYAIGAIMPTLLLHMLVCLVLQTILLAAAAVSSALMVIVFSIMTIALTGMYFGPDFDKTMGFANMLMYLPGWQALNLRPLVQNGFTVIVPNGFLPETYEFVQIAVSEMCLQQGQEANCWEESASDSLFSGQYEIHIPKDSSDMFGGQTAQLTVIPEGGGVEIHIPGGMWIVKGLWTWKGVDNPLAVNRNTMIVMCWIVVCFAIGILTPPWRTARQRLSRGVVPDALQTMATALTPATATESAEEVEENNAGKGHSVESIKAVRSKLVRIEKLVEGGSIANVTTFEPRLCRAPFEYLVPSLKNLLVQTEMVILPFLLQPNENLLLLLPHQNHNNMDEDGANDDEQKIKSDLQTAHAFFKTSAEALTTMDPSALKIMKEGISKDDFFGGTDNSPSRFMLYRASEVRKAVLEWIQVIQEPVPTPMKDVPKNLFKTYLPWVLAPILAFKRLPALLLLPCNPKNWSGIDRRSRDCRNFFWGLKLAVGFIALFVMTIYWPGYASYAIPVGTYPAEDLYCGWHLAAYTFAYRPTAEGTVKKGLQRMVGTCIGGFSAWLAIIVCSGSYDEDAEVNPYGLVAWLTVTTGVVAYLSVDQGYAAQQGLSPDHGFFGFYTVLTQSVIALEYYNGSQSRDSLTANRIVATLTGILMAIVIAFFPPILFGQALNSINHYDDALEEEWEAIVEHAQKGANAEAFSKEWTDQSSFRRRVAVFFIKDAGSLKALPIFRLDPAYIPLVERMFVTESLMWRFIELLDFTPISPEDKTLMSSLSVVSEEGYRPPNKASVVVEEPPSVHISAAQKIRIRLLAHREELAKL